MARISISSRNQSTTKRGDWRPRGFVAWPLVLLVCVVAFGLLKIIERQSSRIGWRSGRVGNVSCWVANYANQPAEVGVVLSRLWEDVEVSRFAPEIMNLLVDVD